MSKKTASEAPVDDIAALKQALAKKDNKITLLEQRLTRIERRAKSNERFANTLSECLATQVVAIDAITGVMRRALQDDVVLQDELMLAIKTYDKHKFRRWLTGFCGTMMWVLSVAVAAFMGAFIYWIFSGK